MQPNALLAWPNFIMEKVDVTILPSLKGISPLKCWVMYYEFFLAVVTPLYFAHVDDLTASHSLCGIQNSDWPLTV
jgi:hypothetical protein